MKARDWRKVLAVLVASMVVAGCGMVSKKKYEEADARALKATTSLNETTQALEKVKALNAQLETSLKQKAEQVAALRAEAKKASEAIKAEVKKLSDELKAARDQVGAIAKELSQAMTKAKEAEQLGTKVQALEQANKQLQMALERLKSPVPKVESNAPTAGAATK